MRRLIAPFAALAVLAACQQPEPPAAEGSAAPTTAAETDVSEPAPPETAEPVSCRDERGQDAAQALADRCRQVSPATRPPCNTANPCTLIQAEIDRSCALWADQGDLPEACGG